MRAIVWTKSEKETIDRHVKTIFASMREDQSLPIATRSTIDGIRDIYVGVIGDHIRNVLAIVLHRLSARVNKPDYDVRFFQSEEFIEKITLAISSAIDAVIGAQIDGPPRERMIADLDVLICAIKIKAHQYQLNESQHFASYIKSIREINAVTSAAIARSQ